MSPDAAHHAADIRAVLESRELTIGCYDVLIVGHARSRGLRVVTENPGEFRRVDGLRSNQQYLAKNPIGYVLIAGCGAPFKLAELQVGEKA